MRRAAATAGREVGRFEISDRRVAPPSARATWRRRGPQAGAYGDQVRGEANPANRPYRPTRARRIVPLKAAGG